MRKLTKLSARFDIDQSVKIEQLNHDTIVGIANSQQSFTLCVPRKIKRHFYEDFRRHGIPKKFPPTLFAASIVALFHKIKITPTALAIDLEYSSHEQLINNFIGSFYPEAVIAFIQVGKNSPAHIAAYLVHRKKRKADAKAGFDELHALINTTTGEPQHLEFTRIHKPNRSVNKKYKRVK